MAHGIIIIFPAAIIHTSKQVESIQAMEFLVLISFSNMPNLIFSQHMKSRFFIHTQNLQIIIPVWLFIGQSCLSRYAPYYGRYLLVLHIETLATL